MLLEQMKKKAAEMEKTVYGQYLAGIVYELENEEE